MRLLNLEIQAAPACGGLLDGLFVSFARHVERENVPVQPICLIGPNGAGKSQLLQFIAEAFQSAWHAIAPNEEREAVGKNALFSLSFEVENTIWQISRRQSGKPILFEKSTPSKEWRVVTDYEIVSAALPPSIIGYTSGQNETLSYPFLVSRSEYAESVAKAALSKNDKTGPSANRLIFIDYSTHFEVLIANLILNKSDAVKSLLHGIEDLQLESFRCIVRLAHRAAPKAPRTADSGRPGIQLTDELEDTVEALKRYATCWNHDQSQDTYTFDFLMSEANRRGLQGVFGDSKTLYRRLHNLAMLNDLAIPKAHRERLKKSLSTRKFGSRLSEPQEADKIFHFEHVALKISRQHKTETIDYLSLSDGEHQHAQIIGVMAMFNDSGTLFLLDEPESHFNPQWRVEFTGKISSVGGEASREVLLTTHAPFVPSDLPSAQVLIMGRDDDEKLYIRRPDITTFGAAFDRIIEHCFDVRPPISGQARDKVNELLESNDIAIVEAGLEELGASVERAYVADHLRKLKNSGGVN
jgi:restriction system-associated AAA family ATPase